MCHYGCLQTLQGGMQSRHVWNQNKLTMEELTYIQLAAVLAQHCRKIKDTLH